MTTHLRAHSKRRGFTLMELMVAMAITTIIVGILINITGTAVDTWNRSRSELRASRQAKAMADVMAADFESLITRSGGDSQWLAAKFEPPGENSADDAAGTSTNAAYLVFYTAATDRYDGQVGVDNVDQGGDVSCVGYQLQWADPIEQGGQNQTFVLRRHLVDPDDTFETMLGQTGDLEDLFATEFGDELAAENSFVCENIFQFTVGFHVEVPEQEETSPGSGDYVTTLRPRVLTLKDGSGDDVIEEFRLTGSGLVTEPTDDTLEGAVLTAVEISMTVLKDSAVNLIRRGSQPTGGNEFAKWLSENTYHYSKLVQLPRK